MPRDFLAGADALTVSGDLHKAPRAVSFGPYATRKAWVNAPQRKEEEPNMFNGYISHAEQRQTAGFELASASGALFKGHCTRESSETIDRDHALVFGKKGMEWEESIARADFTSTFRCGLDGPDGETLRLALIDGRRGKVEGHALEQRLEGLAQARSKTSPPADGSATYLIDEASAKPAGAVILGPEAKDLLRRDLPAAQRDRVAVVAMALLLLRDMQP